MPKISVILPIYNAAQTLSQTLDSLCRQRFDGFELIAVDDGSQDGTPDILNACAKRDSRIRIIQSDHIGLVGALNLGCAHTNSPYMARLDADDLIHPDRLRLQYEFLASHPDIAVVSSRIQCFPRPQIAGGFRLYEHWLNSLCTPEDIAREIFIESPVAHPSVLVRTSAFDRVGGYQDFGWAEDYDLWLNLRKQQKRFYNVDTIQVMHRIHNDSAFNAKGNHLKVNDLLIKYK